MAAARRRTRRRPGPAQPKSAVRRRSLGRQRSIRARTTSPRLVVRCFRSGRGSQTLQTLSKTRNPHRPPKKLYCRHRQCTWVIHGIGPMPRCTIFCGFRSAHFGGEHARRAPHQSCPVLHFLGCCHPTQFIVLADSWTWDGFVKSWKQQLARTAGVVGVVMLVAAAAVAIIITRARR